ncbi:MAG: bifunctional phosphopantothenoylcysteine decarboxylase/phosphopantothenate--cysteine ligase CoaBC [Candidatus Cloacimonetes bacterium]|nr:bifunctional phosphopantothenoylcysteine decarboxylase/phosphopantothenate--cysteine ligase CoaBC [Candidatus Cloacimonadota bacterium]
MLNNRNILLGITGGIAAYKAVDLAGKLTKMGAKIKTIMTQNACEFVSPLTLRSITHQPVITKMFDLNSEIEHISLADWADIIVIAPATANIIGKVASGIADDILSTTIMASTAPVFFVPAMNGHMYVNPIVKANINKLTELGYFFMEPEAGMLACGYEGKGRYPKNREILYFLLTFLEYKRDLTGKTILITAGASQEKIDPIRFISNRSSGKMGLALARAAHIRGAKVKFIHSNINDEVPEYLDSYQTNDAKEMYDTVMKESSKAETIIMVAAVADYAPAQYSKQKIKKSDDLILNFKKTKDILYDLGKKKKTGQMLIGFAAESEKIKQNALMKLKKKNLDFICANDLKVTGKDDTKILLLSSKQEIELSGSKFSVAHQILDSTININKK